MAGLIIIANTATLSVAPGQVVQVTAQIQNASGQPATGVVLRIRSQDNFGGSAVAGDLAPGAMSTPQTLSIVLQPASTPSVVVEASSTSGQSASYEIDFTALVPAPPPSASTGLPLPLLIAGAVALLLLAIAASKRGEAAA